MCSSDLFPSHDRFAVVMEWDPEFSKEDTFGDSEEESDQVVSDSEIAEEIAKMYEIDGNSDYESFKDLENYKTYTPEMFREFTTKYFYLMERTMFDALDVMFTEYASKIMDCKTSEAIDVSAVSAGLASSLVKKIAKVSDHIMGIKPMTEKTLARTLLVKCKLKPVGEIYKKVAIPVDYLDCHVKDCRFL